MRNPKEDHSESPAQEGDRIANTDLLREYEHLKFELASLIRMVGSYACDEEDELRKKCRALQTKLAEDRFYLAVVGQASRGKSTLINALLGMNRLPTGIVLVTSAIASVDYGSREQVRIFAKGWGYGVDVPLEELPHYITEQDNPGNQKAIELAEVRLPAELLRRGFYLVDTPGFGSAISENTLTPRGFLPEADAIVFATCWKRSRGSPEAHWRAQPGREAFDGSQRNS
jgi:ribosome biogenesis GTPase A